MRTDRYTWILKRSTYIHLVGNVQGNKQTHDYMERRVNCLIYFSHIYTYTNIYKILKIIDIL